MIGARLQVFVEAFGVTVHASRPGMHEFDPAADVQPFEVLLVRASDEGDAPVLRTPAESADVTFGYAYNAYAPATMLSPPDPTHGIAIKPQIGPDDDCFDGYPELSIEEWHKRRGLWIE